MRKDFKIGDEVVALNVSESPKAQVRVIGKKYIVQDVMYCPSCGEQCINIGGVARFNSVKCECGEIQDSRGKSWTNSICFSKSNMIEREMSDAAKIEDYEQAAILRDVIKSMNA